MVRQRGPHQVEFARGGRQGAGGDSVGGLRRRFRRQYLPLVHLPSGEATTFFRRGAAQPPVGGLAVTMRALATLIHRTDEVLRVGTPAARGTQQPAERRTGIARDAATLAIHQTESHLRPAVASLLPPRPSPSRPARPAARRW